MFTAIAVKMSNFLFRAVYDYLQRSQLHNSTFYSIPQQLHVGYIKVTGGGGGGVLGLYRSTSGSK